MVVVVGIALGLMLGGALLCYLSPGFRVPILVSIAWWAGVILFVVGLILLLAPAVVWVAAQLRAILGLHDGL